MAKIVFPINPNIGQILDINGTDYIWNGRTWKVLTTASTSLTPESVGLENVVNESKETMFTNPVFTGIPVAPTASLSTNTTQIATTAFVQSSINNIIDSAPTALNTLNELANALGDDANFATTVTDALGNKADKTITISAGSGLTGGGDISANRTISHADTSTQASVNNSGRTYIQDITLDTFGHVTGIASATETVTDTVTRLRGTSTGTFVSGDITLEDGGATTITQNGNTITISSTNTVYTHPSYPGDDIDIDTGVLTGATVISDLDFNITTDTLGHVTDANATISTRNLTAADIGAAASSHTHAYSDLTGTVPTWNQNTTGSAATLTTARTLTVGPTGKSFNGSANVSWSLSEIGINVVTSCPTAAATAGRVNMYIGSTCATKYANWLYFES